MSENRLYLIHKPSMTGILLATNHFGWYVDKKEEFLQEFFDWVTEEYGEYERANNFILFSEDDGTDIIYGEMIEGTCFRKFEIRQNPDTPKP